MCLVGPWVLGDPENVIPANPLVTPSNFYFLKSTLRTSVADPNPHGSGTFAWIQQKVKEQIN